MRVEDRSSFNFYLAGKFLERKGELRDFFEPYYNKYVFAHVLYESFGEESVDEMNDVLRNWTEEINEILSEDSEDRYLQRVKELLQELTLEIKNFSLK